MKLNDAARELIGDGTDATLVTLNADGSPQVTVVWMALESTPDGDELVSAHLTEYQKTRNIRRDPRVAVTILATRQAGQQTPYLAITGTARIEEGGAPALLKKLAKVMLGSATSTSHRRMRRKVCSPGSESRRWAAWALGRPDGQRGCNTFQFVPSCVGAPLLRGPHRPAGGRRWLRGPTRVGGGHPDRQSRRHAARRVQGHHSPTSPSTM